MGRDADRRADRRQALAEVILEAEAAIAVIEEDRPGTELLETARAIIPGLRACIAQCRAMPKKTLPDIEAANHVAVHIEKAAARAYVAARCYPYMNLVFDAASYCGVATEAIQDAAKKRAAAGKGGKKSHEEDRALLAEFREWYLERRAAFKTKDEAAEAGTKVFRLSFETLRQSLTGI